jgi:hypothetical protein
MQEEKGMNMNNNQSRKGNLLKIKQGYNPNSSSIGSIIFTIPGAVIASGILAGTISGIITHYFMKKQGTPHGGKKKNSRDKNKKDAS